MYWLASILDVFLAAWTIDPGVP